MKLLLGNWGFPYVQLETAVALSFHSLDFLLSSPTVSHGLECGLECTIGRFVGVVAAVKACTSISNRLGGLSITEMKHLHVVIHVVSLSNAALLKPSDNPVCLR